MFSKRILFVLVVVLTGLLAVPAVPSSGQDDPGVTINLTPYEGNPILDKGPAGSWESGAIYMPAVVFHEGLYHMFYTGNNFRDAIALGYATSSDGLVWEKYASNPVFGGDGTGFDAACVFAPAVLVEGDTWVVYYSAQERCFTPGDIGRATAPAPTGPWTREEQPVLRLGSKGEWDSGFVFPFSVIATGEGYRLYYGGVGDSGEAVGMLGLATSPDGITWTKFDDPSTTESPFAKSDPVLQVSAEGWDTIALVPYASVRQSGEGWEMFYSGRGQLEGSTAEAFRIGYATSDDGIHWVKYDGNPVLTGDDDPAEPADQYTDLAAGAAVVNDSTYLLYYDYYPSAAGSGIGVATGTVTRE